MTSSGHGEWAPVLDRLARACRESERGFRLAAAAVIDPTLQRLFESYADQRAGFARELLGQVERLGAQPTASSPETAAPPRRSSKPDRSPPRRDEGAILAECARGEAAALHAFQDAAGLALPGALGELIDRQYVQVSEGHDHVCRLEQSELDPSAAVRAGI
jgi:uncharacterized protein (TIGR02284 family)